MSVDDTLAAAPHRGQVAMTDAGTRAALRRWVDMAQIDHDRARYRGVEARSPRASFRKKGEQVRQAELGIAGGRPDADAGVGAVWG
jgi:hypothetical protein